MVRHKLAVADLSVLKRSFLIFEGSSSSSLGCNESSVESDSSLVTSSYDGSPGVAVGMGSDWENDGGLSWRIWHERPDCERNEAEDFVLFVSKWGSLLPMTGFYCLYEGFWFREMNF